MPVTQEQDRHERPQDGPQRGQVEHEEEPPGLPDHPEHVHLIEEERDHERYQVLPA